MERRSFTDDLYNDLGGSCLSADTGGDAIFCAQPRMESVQSVPSWSYVPQPGVRRGSFNGYGRERSAPQGGNSMAHAPLHSRGFREGSAMACANIWGSPPDLPWQLSQPRAGMMPHISPVPVGRTTGGGCSNHPTPHDQLSAELSAMGGGRVLQGASPTIGMLSIVGAAQAPRNSEVHQRRMPIDVQARGVDSSSPDLFCATDSRGYRQWHEEGRSDARTGFSGNTAGETGEAVVEGTTMGNRGESAEKDDDDGTISAAPDKIDEGVGDRTKPPPAGGRKRKGGSSPRQPKKNNPWSLEERLDLAKFASEDDALMADAEGAQACMTRSKRWEWVAGRLGDIGYSRTAEDCRKKWAELVKKSVTCDDTLASEDLRGGGSPSGGEAGSEGGGTDASDTATKTRRTSSRKARGGDSPALMYGMTSVMEESTRALCEGLDKAASTLARASTDGSRMVVTEIGAVVGAMRQGNAVLEMLVGVMAARGAGSGRGWQPRHGPLHKEIDQKSYHYYSVDVNGKATVDLDAAIGYHKRQLSHVLVWVKKVGSFIPDDWESLTVDIVGDIVLKLVDNLAEDHDWRLDNGAFFYTYLDPLLVGRGYLHGEIRM
ncbi:hypothetical protein CBR_g8793 [Chara braunii]|uniref:Myb-like domain-containing protein n=1 Tax=Chara braunii TaxID=69332 RepID=A0A388KMT5_CHABU|nr:hypothetical protein CBR_g8793 [Chara braunii]|eukprot:GBG71374.1 hypothetical protein CBR_g8793 [Chara braunii]